MKFWKEIRKKKEKLKLGPTRLSGTRQKMNIKTLISFVYFLEWKKSRSSLRWCSRALELRWCSKLCSLLKEMIGFLFKNLKMIMCHCSEMLQKNAIKCLEFHHLPFTLESENIGILETLFVTYAFSEVIRFLSFEFTNVGYKLIDGVQ